MSTCPDKVVFSEYIDGELPSPWKEKLESHVSTCEACSKILKQHSTLKKALTPSTQGESFNYEQSYSKLLNKLHAVKSNQGSNSSSRTTDQSWWQNSVQIPFPALAAAVLMLFALPLAILVFRSGSVSRDNQVAETQQMPYYSVRPQSSYFGTQVSTNPSKAQTKSAMSGNEFIKFYMPREDESPNIIIINTPEALDYFMQYSQMNFMPRFNGGEIVEPINE